VTAKAIAKLTEGCYHEGHKEHEEKISERISAPGLVFFVPFVVQHLDYLDYL
jgi:hypothetical protein